MNLIFPFFSATECLDQDGVKYDVFQTHLAFLIQNLQTFCCANSRVDSEDSVKHAIIKTTMLAGRLTLTNAQCNLFVNVALLFKLNLCTVFIYI